MKSHSCNHILLITCETLTGSYIINIITLYCNNSLDTKYICCNQWMYTQSYILSCQTPWDCLKINGWLFCCQFLELKIQFRKVCCALIADRCGSQGRQQTPEVVLPMHTTFITLCSVDFLQAYNAGHSVQNRQQSVQHCSQKSLHDGNIA